MKAIDTNVLARVLVDDPDDPEAVRQRPAAIAALSERVFVPVTVLLELEWVLRGFYELSRTEVSRVLNALCGLENVTLEDREVVLTALERHRDGLDFADALHLARSHGCAAFVTLDKKLARRGAKVGARPRVELLRPRAP